MVIRPTAVHPTCWRSINITLLSASASASPESSSASSCSPAWNRSSPLSCRCCSSPPESTSWSPAHSATAPCAPSSAPCTSPCGAPDERPRPAPPRPGPVRATRPRRFMAEMYGRLFAGAGVCSATLGPDAITRYWAPPMRRPTAPRSWPWRLRGPEPNSRGVPPSDRPGLDVRPRHPVGNGRRRCRAVRRRSAAAWPPTAGPTWAPGSATRERSGCGTAAMERRATQHRSR